MTPNKQVSPAIRILRGERDASARATHLEAATRKFLVTTNERKQMSTKTNFKRIALVAVAALGLGVLSSVPSQANIIGTVAVTTANGTATTAVVDSTTAGSISVRWLANSASDSVVIATSLNSAPASATTSPSLVFYPTDTATSINPAVLVPASRTTGTNTALGLNDTAVVKTGTITGSQYVAGKFKFQIETSTSIVAGTYTYTLTIQPWGTTGAETTKTQTVDVSIVVTALASASATATAAASGATFGTSGNLASTYSAAIADSSTAFSAVASGSPVAQVRVYLKNDSGGTASIRDSVTVTIDKGTVGVSGASYGKSVVYNYGSTEATNGYLDAFVYADGTTGKGTITIATKNAGTFTKTVNFLASTVSSIVAGQRLTVISTTAETAASGNAIRAQAFDANGTNFAASTALYAYSSDTTVISNYGTACGATALSTSDYQWYTYCPLTGLKAGTATITIRDAATVAASTVASNAVSMRVSTGVATSVTMATDKASYAPGEKGYLIITVKDAAGLVMPAGTYANLFTSTGIQTSNGVTVGAINTTLASSTVDTITGKVTLSGTNLATASWTTIRSSASTTAPSSNDPIAFVLFYAPTAAGSFTFTATGDSSLPAANRVAVTATATVADSASAALAAVSALAVTVASLKTLITTLTNLVLKIQKKVKA